MLFLYFNEKHALAPYLEPLSDKCHSNNINNMFNVFICNTLYVEFACIL